MTFLEFTFTFTLMILFASPAICGWFIVTRGEWHTRPDGTWKKYGMIFKEWSLFWEQYRSERRVYFRGEELEKKIDLLEDVRPDIGCNIYTQKDGLSCYKGTNDGPFDHEIKAIHNLFNCEVDSYGGGRFGLYIVEPIYLFPSWVRKPLSECPTCMASVYGSAFYWFVVIQAHTLFSWSSKEFLAKLGFWVIFCLILACANKFIDQKMKL